MLTWLYIHFGIPGTGPWYAFWSGPGSDIQELAIFGGLYMIWRHHNCHVRGCWRISRHQAGDYVVCRKHHPSLPDEAPTAEQIRAHVEDRVNA